MGAAVVRICCDLDLERCGLRADRNFHPQRRTGGATVPSDTRVHEFQSKSPNAPHHLQVAYDKCWHAVQATEADEIEELGALVRQLERDAWSRPRQFVRVPDSRHSALALVQAGGEDSASPCDGGGGHSSSCCSRIVLDAKFGVDRGRGRAEEEAAAAASSMGGPGHVALVTCLNQLMAQAAGVN